MKKEGGDPALLQATLSPEVVIAAAKQLMSLMPFSQHEKTVKRALQLYRNGHVYNVSIIKDYTIKGKVSDRRITYEPVMNLAAIREHTCSCEKENICEHVIAMFFYVYNQTKYVGELIHKWKGTSHLEKITHTEQLELVSESETGDDLIQTWWKQFEQKYDEFRQRRKRMKEMELPHELVHGFFQPLVRSTPSATFTDRLYHFHAALFTLIHLFKLEHLYKQNQNPIHPHYAKAFWQQIVQDFITIFHRKLGDIVKKKAKKSEEPLLVQTIPYVRQLLLVDGSLKRVAQTIYDVIWEFLFEKEEWRAAERQYTMKQLEASPSDEQWLYASSHLSFLLKDDEQAYTLIDRYPHAAIQYIVSWLDFLIEKKEKQRATFWVEKLTEHSSRYVFAMPMHERHWLVEKIEHTYKKYAGLSKDFSYYEPLLQSLLPYSLEEYLNWLFSKEKYRTVVDLYMIIGMTAENINPSDMREIERKDRSIVLPLYHQAIQWLINQKNRDSYQVAVQFLKRLRIHYNMLKRTDRWETYMEKLLDQTKRLRAFQEELKKGNLL